MQTYNVKIKMSVISSQFPAEKGLEDFLREILTDYQGDEYKSTIQQIDVQLHETVLYGVWSQTKGFVMFRPMDSACRIGFMAVLDAENLASAMNKATIHKSNASIYKVVQFTPTKEELKNNM